MYSLPIQSPSLSCCPIPLLSAYRLLLSVLCCADVVRFSAAQHRRDTDNPEKTPVGPLLLRCLAFVLLSAAAYLCHAAALTVARTAGRPSRPRSPLQPLGRLVLSFAQSMALCSAAVYGVSALLSPHPPLSSLLPSLVFSLHAAFLCAPQWAESAAGLSTGLVLPSSEESAPLLCAWLSCYWLALDHDDKWQVWPLAALVALHGSHAAIALTAAIRARYRYRTAGSPSRAETSKAAVV